jgi:hypothetical protein
MVAKHVTDGQTERHGWAHKVFFTHAMLECEEHLEGNVLTAFSCFLHMPTCNKFVPSVLILKHSINSV